ncbi:aromatic-L-amino-acid/L-tryptophan decarboxylase [Phycisphaerales bacterium]|nr:aromatic-L-amino-acid/L-tryptophan decarboxylase [Phycisphaerales bacterium]
MPDPAPPHMPAGDFRNLAAQTAAWLTGYWERVEHLPVRSLVQPGDILRALPEHAPETGQPLPATLFDDLDRIILPGLTHWQHPSFFAYFPSNISAPAIIGDLLSAGLGVQGMSWITSPACTELEMRVLDWLGEAIGLPNAFLFRGQGGAVIDGTASEAALGMLLAAKRRALRVFPRDGQRAAAQRLTIYTSTQSHSSIIKAAMIAGLALDAEDRKQLRLIETDSNYAMRPDALADAIRADLADGLIPTFISTTLGTTSSTANDPLDAIASAVRSTGATPWLHVDAAHSGAAFICPEHRAPLRGLEHFDSFAFNPHKWLLTNFDCNCLWTRSPRDLIDAMSITPEYLRNQATDSGAVVDYRDWHIPLGRRFRSLKLWLVMRHYGLEGLRAHIREDIALTQLFESLVRADSRFEVVTPRTVNLICFRLAPRPGENPAATDARNKALLDQVNATGMLYFTHTVLPGIGGAPPRYVLRMAIGGVRTEERHVREAWTAIASAAS